MPLDVARVQANRPQNTIHYLPSTASTMLDAAKLAEAGAAHGTVVVADEQTAGVGRLGRSWHSDSEMGLYCSVVLRLPLPSGVVPVITLLLGLATAEAIQNTTNLVCDLRWPNDALIRDGKVAGILAQLSGATVIAGIGINVNHSALPEGLRTPGTSLRIESGRTWRREELLEALLQSIDNFCALLLEQGAGAIVRAFTAASSFASGRRVRIEENNRTGTTAGLDSNGFLLVRFDNGVTERVSSGGVRAEV